MPNLYLVRSMAVMLVLFLAFTLVCHSTAQADNDSLLDGKTFVGPTGEKGKAAYASETLEFRNGKLYSVECARWGFGDGMVTTHRVGDAIQFEAETFSKEYGKMVWRGVVRADTIEATYHWHKKGWFLSTVLDYWFNGTRRKD